MKIFLDRVNAAVLVLPVPTLPSAVRLGTRKMICGTVNSK